MSTPDGSRDNGLFADLSRIVLPGRAISGLLDLIVNLAVSTVDGVTEASVSVIHHDSERLETANATSPRIRAVDEAQYHRAQGPCVRAIQTGQEVTVQIPTSQWPEFSDRAAAAGIRSVHSLPLADDRRTIGALNLFSASETALTGSAVRVARALASQASVVLANATALAAAEMTNRQLQEALETRDLIGQAKGILMARQRIDAGTAFDILRRASQRTNRKLRDVAAELIEHHRATATGR